MYVCVCVCVRVALSSTQPFSLGYLVVAIVAPFIFYIKSLSLRPAILFVVHVFPAGYISCSRLTRTPIELLACLGQGGKWRLAPVFVEHVVVLPPTGFDGAAPTVRDSIFEPSASS